MSGPSPRCGGGSRRPWPGAQGQSQVDKYEADNHLHEDKDAEDQVDEEQHDHDYGKADTEGSRDRGHSRDRAAGGQRAYCPCTAPEYPQSARGGAD